MNFANIDTTGPIAQDIFAPAIWAGTECDPDVRDRRAHENAAAARQWVAEGKFICRDGGGSITKFDPGYFSRGFRRERWMEAADIAAAARVPQMAVGETITLARGYHPRHGVKRYTLTRLA